MRYRPTESTITNAIQPFAFGMAAIIFFLSHMPPNPVLGRDYTEGGGNFLSTARTSICYQYLATAMSGLPHKVSQYFTDILHLSENVEVLGLFLQSVVEVMGITTV